jgi:hypothetical protein
MCRLGLVVLCCLVVLGPVSGCAGVLAPRDSVTAVGWAADGQLVVARAADDWPATLWMAAPGEDLARVEFSHCEPIQVWSVLRLSAGQVALTVWCAEPPETRIVRLGLTSGGVEVLAAAVGITGGSWSHTAGVGFVEYRAGQCHAVGEVDRGGVVRPLALAVASMPLAAWFPQPGASSCAARALARRAAVAAGGRFWAFFLHACDVLCAGDGEFAGAWKVIVQDRVTGWVSVSASTFTTPHGLAVSDDGAVAVSAGYQGSVGLWYCSSATCTEPSRLAKGIFDSPDFGPGGDKLAAVEIGGTDPEVISIRRT